MDRVMPPHGTHATTMSTGRYTFARAFAAEGARVGLVTCRDCGASLLLDEANDFDVFAVHDDWHASFIVAAGGGSTP